MNKVEINFMSKDTKPLVVGNQVFWSVYDFTLTDEDLERARRDLGETQEKREVCLRQLKEKLSSDAGANNRKDDVYILRYLRVRKYDVEKAHQNIKVFYEQRKKHSKFFIISSKTISLQKLNWYTVLPYTDEERRILIFCRINVWNPYKTSFLEMARTVSNSAELCVMNPKSQVNGILLIYDMTDISLKHIVEMLKNGELITCLSLIQHAYPVRIKKFIAFNTNRLVRYLFNILKTFMQKKLTERIFLLGSDINELHQHVNPALLPKSLNGTLEEESLNMAPFVLDNLSYLNYERSFTGL